MFLVQNWPQPLACKTHGFHERWQPTFSTGIKCYNGRVSFQPIRSSEESASHCSQNLRERAFISNIQIATLSKDVDELLKLAQWVVNYADSPNREKCMTKLLYNVDQPGSS